LGFSAPTVKDLVVEEGQKKSPSALCFSASLIFNSLPPPDLSPVTAMCLAPICICARDERSHRAAGDSSGGEQLEWWVLLEPQALPYVKRALLFVFSLVPAPAACAVGNARQLAARWYRRFARMLDLLIPASFSKHLLMRMRVILCVLL
jgi:hypothetical protein